MDIFVSLIRLVYGTIMNNQKFWEEEMEIRCISLGTNCTKEYHQNMGSS